MSDLVLDHIKNKMNSDYGRTIAETESYVFWLLDEVERLKSSPTLGDREDVIAMTASRCAEIVDEYGHDPIAQCILRTIRKEFEL